MPRVFDKIEIDVEVTNNKDIIAINSFSDSGEIIKSEQICGRQVQ